MRIFFDLSKSDLIFSTMSCIFGQKMRFTTTKVGVHQTSVVVNRIFWPKIHDILLKIRSDLERSKKNTHSIYIEIKNWSIFHHFMALDIFLARFWPKMTEISYLFDLVGAIKWPKIDQFWISIYILCVFFFDLSKSDLIFFETSCFLGRKSLFATTAVGVRHNGSRSLGKYFPCA